VTELTPTFAELQQAKSNGAAGPVLHVSAAHEPTREGEQPLVTGAAAPPTATAPVARTVPLKVALIGTAPSSRMLAPYNDPSWQIWGCSPGNQNTLPRVNLWFELHSNLLWPEYESYGKPYIEWLKQQTFPVYMQERWPTTDGQMVPVQTIVPNAIAYPKDEIVAEFGDDFFTSSFAWMMALAIKMGATEIALYGIDMASREEYIRQRPGFFFFRYMAKCRGIRVSAPHESDIMQSPALYAYADSTPFGRKILARRQEVAGRIAGFDQQIGQASNSKTYLQGALEDLDYFESIWSGVCNDMGRLEHENALLKAKIVELKAPKIELMPMTSSFTLQPVMNVSVGMTPPAPAPIKQRRRRMHVAPPQPPADEAAAPMEGQQDG
jgi:hypothetical protein